MTRTLFIDFESFYDRKAGYDLKQISITEYIRDLRFKAHGLAYMWGDDHEMCGPLWVSRWDIPAFIASLDWKNTIVVGHNVKFDGAILSWRYSIKPKAWICTQALSEAVVGSHVPSHSLATMARYLGLKDKGEMKTDGIRDMTPEQESDLAEYCRNDVQLCKGIYDLLMPRFPEGQLWHVDWTVRCFVEPRLELDQAVLDKGVADEKKRREEIINKSGVDRAVLSSNKRFAEHLQHAGISVPTKLSSRTGRHIPAFARTDEGLAKLAITAPDLHAARIASKSNLLETRGEALSKVSRTGPFPFDIAFSGANQTHRYAGRSGGGGNPQNFTRSSFLRRAVKAPEEHSLLVGDFAKIEVCFLAWLAQDQRLMRKITNDENLYIDFASAKYGRPITKADKAEYQYGKESVLGLGYQMGWRKFKDRIRTVIGKDISKEEARETVDLYRSAYFKVPKLWENCQSAIPFIAEGKVGCLFFAPFIKVRRGALVLPSGLEIRYPNLRYGIYFDQARQEQVEGWHYDAWFKKTAASPVGLYGGLMTENLCQALTGELCKEAIRRAEEEFGLPIVGQVHDELLAVIPDEEDDFPLLEYANFLKNCMERSPRWMPTLKVRAEVGIGKDWLGAKI